ncbi:hypothetical protein B0H13DRAFT_2654272 [Mycena leptocephala]|nr:hypothetical protein B0H13DRAFT_2654272 [Mycena leptocephala]
MTSPPSDPPMTSHSFQLLSDQEVIQLKRTRGIMACAECQRRKLKCDKKFPCSSCVRRGRADICPTGDMGPIGRGRRIMRSESLELSTTIHNMGDRIRQLETAVAEAHAEGAGESDSTHPLLREDLLAIKRTSELPSESGETTPAQLVNTFGSLAVSASGTPRYFGPTAGASALLSVQGNSGGDRAEFALPFADVVESFPFRDTHGSSSWDTGPCLDTLLGQLPDELRAWALYDIFVCDASWYGTPILPDELHELVTYLYDPKSNIYELSPHALAVVFFAFASAEYADLSLLAYSSQADTYFDLGRTALTLQPVFGSTDLHTIQALSLAGLYYATGGPRYSVDSSWTITSMAVGLCQTLRLHRESEHIRLGLDNKTIQRRRALFWEVYSLETYQALSFAEGRTVPGFFHAKWKFTKEVTAPMAQTYTRATPPTYDEVLDLDHRLRQFMERAPFPLYFNATGPSNTLLAYVRANLIPRFAGNLMVYMHRSSFVQALKDRPLDPLDSPYAASFLAAYRGASMIIKSDMRSFSLFPEHFHRWWPIWKSLVNASFIVGSIVAKCPTSAMAPAAFLELLAAVELVERGATHSFLAEGSLPVLLRLRNKAIAVYSAFRSLDAPLPPANTSELADDKDFAMLGGSHTIVHRDSIPNSNSTSLIPTDGVSLAVPSLIPGLMPPPTTPDPWQTPLPVVWFSGFPFESPMCGRDAPVNEDCNEHGLEAYLAAQIQMESTVFPSEHCRERAPVSEAEWASFLSILEQ